MDDSGQNSIVIVSGANLLLSEADVLAAEEVLKNAKIVVCQLEIKPETTLAAMKLARKHGVKTILNPAPAQADLDSDMYKFADFFCPNETEAELLTGQKVESIQDAQKAMEVLLDRGCKFVIITMGAQGAVFASQENKSAVHVPAPKVNAIDTTGAGDAFVGSLAYYISQGKLELKECLQRAVEIASISVQGEGTQTSFPKHEAIPKHLLWMLHVSSFMHNTIFIIIA